MIKKSQIHYALIPPLLFIPLSAQAQNGQPTSHLSHPSPIHVTPDPRFLGTDVILVPATTPMQVLLAKKYQNEKLVTELPSNFPIPVLHLSDIQMPVKAVASAKPISLDILSTVRPAYRPDPVNEPVIDTSQAPSR